MVLLIPHAPLLATIVPGITGFFIYAIRRWVKRGFGWIATAASLISFLLILSMAPQLLETFQTEGRLIYTYTWIRPINLDFGFLIDMVSLPIGLIIALISAISSFYSVKYMEEKKDQAGYYANLLLFASGMIGVILSENLILFYLFWELMLIPSYFLIAVWGESEKGLEIGFKYFLFTHVGALSMLLGFLSIYSYTGTFKLVELSLKFTAIPPTMTVVIFILLLIGFFVKMAVFPVHTWLPDAHSEAPTPISAMLSGIMIKCGAYGMARILLPTFGQGILQASNYLTIFGVVSMFYGGLMALAQTDIKRLLAYSSISQVGYIVFGLGSASTLGIMGGLFHIINHAICKSLLFMCVGVIMHQTGTRDIRELGGLIGKMPITGITFLIGTLSLVGIPLLNSFWSEWMIFGGGLATGKILITVIGVIGTVITAGYYMRFAWQVFFGSTPENLDHVKEAHLLLRAPLVILAAISIVLGVLPGLMLEFITPAAEYISSFING